ncbi:MAG: nucleoside-diphosphate kinase [Lentisphaerae bacterium]|jgi:nucleoside diphosphate kinase|nr:nucleoside-diphosphate kinase [Lentisphaerota bacterium]
MAKELAFVLINPYSIRKSRTGGIIARYLVQTDLKLVGARMFGASRELADKFAEYATTYDPTDPGKCRLLADYIGTNYGPDPVTGRTHRCMMLLLEGEEAISRVFEVTGGVRQNWGAGQTVRDIFGDFVTDGASGEVLYFEPSVIVAPTVAIAAECFKIWQGCLNSDAGIVRGASDVEEGPDVERTLVLIKPENFRHPSLRAGNIMSLLSRSGLRIVGVKKFAMTVAQAEEFYGPVRDSLRHAFPKFGVGRMGRALEAEFGMPIALEHLTTLCEAIAPDFAEFEFENIVEFMSGRRPSSCSDAIKQLKGSEECLALVYEGVDAVAVIRNILGSTDPSKASCGTIRREFGTNIMVNAAHASDSPENALREMNIIDIERDPLFEELIQSYYQ